MGLISLTTKIFHKEVFLIREVFLIHEVFLLCEEYIMESFKMSIFSFIVQEYISKGQYFDNSFYPYSSFKSDMSLMPRSFVARKCIPGLETLSTYVTLPSDSIDMVSFYVIHYDRLDSQFST